MSTSPIIVALDEIDHLDSVLPQIDPHLCRVKIGKGLFTRLGPSVVERVHRLGFEVFLDLKFHDIPNTVAVACRHAAQLGIWMLNIHASGGSSMMQSAADAIEGCDHRPILIAVTVLTSMTQEALQETGVQSTLSEHAIRLATLASNSGCDGVVCSPWEAADMKAHVGRQCITVTPGVRSAGMATHDQKRLMTPEGALVAGSDYLVIGREITQAQSPGETLRALIQRLKN